MVQLLSLRRSPVISLAAIRVSAQPTIRMIHGLSRRRSAGLPDL